MDKMADNGWTLFSLPGDFINSLTAPDRHSFSYNEITGERKSSLPKPFIHDIGLIRDKEGNITGYDSEKISKQLGQTMNRYVEAVFKYKAMESIEQQVNLILDVESLKDHIEVNKQGKAEILRENGENIPRTTPGNGNFENAQMLDKFVQYLVYENRYPGSQDTTFGSNKLVNGVKKLMNDKLGTHFEESTTSLSMIKTLDALKRATQFKVLGGSLAAGLVNYFGAQIQALAQETDYFTFKEMVKEEFDFNNMFKWNEEKALIFSKLVDKMHPFTENENYAMFKKASTSTLGKLNFGDIIFTFMRVPEMKLQSGVFTVLMKNFMAVDGKIVNITQHVKDKYPDRYEGTFAERKEIQKKIQEEVALLKSTSSLMKNTSLKDGELHIEGLDLNDKHELHKFAFLSKSIYKRITGNNTGTSVNMANMDVWLSQMMTFKNWIPKLWYTRFEALEKKNDPFNRDAYDVGRVKVFWDLFTSSIYDRTNKITSVLKGTDEGIEHLDALYTQYAEEYLKNTGQELTMDKSKFNDMIVQNLSNQMRELAILLSMFAAMTALGFVRPPDDDKQAKSALRIATRTADQFVQELSFFYNPVNFQNLLSGSLFPSLGLIKDVEKFVGQLAMETTGFDYTNPHQTAEQVRKQAHPVKFGLKLFPVASTWMQYLTLIDPSLAKDLGVQPPAATIQNR